MIGVSLVVQVLTDIGVDAHGGLVSRLSVRLQARLRHVVSENQRTLAAARCLREGDLVGLGALMSASHESLSNDYAVSCPELDFLVALKQQSPGVLGARMVGGGFGGCTLNLVHQHHVDSFIAEASRRYKAQFNRSLTPILVRPGPGAHVIRHA